MKHIQIFVALIISLNTSAQQNTNSYNKISATVQKAFKLKYPNAIVKSWRTKNEISVSKFVLDNKKYEAMFDTTGKWIKTTTRLSWKEAPKIIKESFKKTAYQSWRIDYFMQIDSLSQSPVYVVEIDNQFNSPVTEHSTIFYDTVDVYISQNGEIIKVLKKC